METRRANGEACSDVNVYAEFENGTIAYEKRTIQHHWRYRVAGKSILVALYAGEFELMANVEG